MQAVWGIFNKGALLVSSKLHCRLIAATHPFNCNKSYTACRHQFSVHITAYRIATMDHHHHHHHQTLLPTDEEQSLAATDGGNRVSQSAKTRPKIFNKGITNLKWSQARGRVSGVHRGTVGVKIMLNRKSSQSPRSTQVNPMWHREALILVNHT